MSFLWKNHWAIFSGNPAVKCENSKRLQNSKKLAQAVDHSFPNLLQEKIQWIRLTRPHWHSMRNTPNCELRNPFFQMDSELIRAPYKKLPALVLYFPLPPPPKKNKQKQYTNLQVFFLGGWDIWWGVWPSDPHPAAAIPRSRERFPACANCRTPLGVTWWPFSVGRNPMLLFSRGWAWLVGVFKVGIKLIT